MIRIISYSILLLISFIAKAQVTEKRTVENFSKIKVATGIEVFYTVSSAKSMEVETDDTDKLKLIKTEFNGDLLNIYVDTKDYKEKKSNKRIFKNTINGVEFKTIKITVFGPNLSGIKVSSGASIKFSNSNKSDDLTLEASSSGDIYGDFEAKKATIDVSSSGNIKGSIDATDLQIKTSSSGDFTGTINATSVEIESSSSSDLNLSGKATKISIKASSSSDCNLKNVTVEEAIIGASSSADVSLTVIKSIDAKSTSSADIVYYGNPNQIKVTENSSGSITSK